MSTDRATELRALAARLDADGDELGVAHELRALADKQDPSTGEMLAVPVSAARHIAEAYGFDQVIVIARRVGEAPDPFGEHVTTFGRNAEHCGVAARVGNFLKHRIMGWPEHEVPPAELPVIDEDGMQRGIVEYTRSLQRGYRKSIATQNALRAARGEVVGEG